ncbi:MAG: restriction endonuclease subunit S [Pyrinomonadaceae bacterium]
MQDETLTETLSLTDEETPLPEGWRLVRLGDVCYQGKMIIEPSSEKAKNLPYLGLESVESGTGKILSSASEVLSDEGKSTTFYFNSKHILYGKLRPYLNKVALPDFEGRCTTEMIPLLPTEDAAREYLLLILRRQETVNAVMRETTGSRMPRADMTTLLNLKIPLPPTIEEQRRIAAILDEQMKAVERARLAVEEQLKAARLLPNAFLRSVFESEDAQSWQKRKLVEIGKIKAGGTPSRGNKNYFKGNINWVKTLDLNCSLVKSTEEQISEDALSSMRGEVLPVGTVMVAMYGGAGTIGKSGLLGIEATTNQAVCSILPNKETFVSDFLHFWLVYIRPEWMRFSSGNRRDPNINKNAVEQMLCPLPSINQQRTFAEKLNEQMQEVEKLKKTLTEQLEAIKKMPSALLRKAFAGEI